MPPYNRRKFFKSVGALSLAGVVSPAVLAALQKDKAFRNIVFIIGDDHSTSVLGCYGNKKIRTPNLDGMALNGTLFTHAFANSPVCTPSRQSFLTGRLPHAAGVTLLQTPFPEEQVTIADHLSQFGFTSAIIGKNHFNNQKEGVNHGFDVKIEAKDYRQHLAKHPPRKVPEGIKTRGPWRPFRDPARIWLNSERLPSALYDADSEGTFFANQAIAFMEQHQDQRFCLWLGFNEPHSPFNFPIEYADKYRPGEMVLPQGTAEDDRWIPLVFKDLTDDEKRGIMAAYYNSVEYLDKNVGLVLNGLKRLGLEKDTIVVYIGDHGYLLNDHKRFEKHMMWEPAVKAPLLIQAGRRYGQGVVCEALTEFIDLVPTLIEAVGVKSIPGVQGKSMVPVLAKNKNSHRKYVFSEFLVDNKVMLRSRDWKYVFTSGKTDLGQGYETGHPAPGITHWLYDLQKDPNETTNLAPSGRHEKLIREMQQELLKIFRATHPYSARIPKSLPVEEQLVLFCEPLDGENKEGK
ncbi:choline-sulfatase [soil metagenome]